MDFRRVKPDHRSRFGYSYDLAATRSRRDDVPVEAVRVVIGDTDIGAARQWGQSQPRDLRGRKRGRRPVEKLRERLLELAARTLECTAETKLSSRRQVLASVTIPDQQITMRRWSHKPRIRCRSTVYEDYPYPDESVTSARKSPKSKSTRNGRGADHSG